MDVRKGQWWRMPDGHQFRVLAVAEKYAMCRYKGCYPFVMRFKDFDPCVQLAIATNPANPENHELLKS